MDTEYLADLVAGRVRDFLLYNKEGNIDSELFVTLNVLRKRLKGIISLDVLEPANES